MSNYLFVYMSVGFIEGKLDIIYAYTHLLCPGSEMVCLHIGTSQPT